MVKRSRDQSQEAPRRRSWRVMVPPDSSFQAQARSRNASRPRSWRRLALGLQLALQDHVYGDPGVVGAGHPQGVEPVHPLGADEDVLQGVDQRVAQVKGARHVGRRDHDAVRRAGMPGVRPEVPALLPFRIPARLHGGGLVAIGNRRAGGGSRRRHALERVSVALDGFSSDPVGRGFGASRARPGAHITGVVLASETEPVLEKAVTGATA